IRSAFSEWAVGPQTTIVTGGARGADILAAEAGLERGAQIVLCLALPPEELEQRSVALPNTNWQSRLRAPLDSSDVRLLEAAGDSDRFARANAWMVETVHALDPEPHTLIVWDGHRGDGPGGTFDLIQRLGFEGPHPRVRVVDPTRRL